MSNHKKQNMHIRSSGVVKGITCNSSRSVDVNGYARYIADLRLIHSRGGDFYSVGEGGSRFVLRNTYRMRAAILCMYHV